MSAALLIKAHKDKIQLNPYSLSGNLYPLINDGHGGNIEDREATPTSKSYTNDVRISYEIRHINKYDSTGTPITIQRREHFMVSDNETPVDVRLEFTYNGVTLKVTQRKELRKYNTLIGYEYELKNITESEYYGS